MNWKKWLSRQVKSRSALARGWISSLLDRGSGCKGGSCARAQPEATAARNMRNGFQRLLANRGNRMSTTNTQATRLLDEVMTRLYQAIRECGEAAPLTPSSADGPPDVVDPSAAVQLLPDAIDRERASSARRTALTKLRESDVVEQFRRELETQSLTVTTVAAFLQMLQQVLPLLRVG